MSALGHGSSSIITLRMSDVFSAFAPSLLVGRQLRVGLLDPYNRARYSTDIRSLPHRGETQSNSVTAHQLWAGPGDGPRARLGAGPLRSLRCSQPLLKLDCGAEMHIR
jgi:hypothetical protein